MTVPEREKKAVSNQVDGAYYQRHSSVQFDLENQAVKSLSIGGDESVLDIGCGDGQVTRQLSQATSGRVLGIDSSESMIDIAIKNDKNASNLNFQKDSALSVIKGESFDIATCFSVLHWIRETEAFFEAAFQNLKPGGKLLILTYPADSPYWVPLNKTIARLNLQKKTRHGFRTSEEYRHLANKKGFKSVCFTEITEYARYKTFEDYRDYVMGWLPLMLQTDPVEETEFWNYLKTCLNDSYPFTDRDYVIPYKKLTMLMEKSDET